MRVMILGYGSVGGVVSKLLLKEKEISQIICCDINVKKERKEGKLLFKKVDVKDKKAFSEILQKTKPDLLINVLIPVFNDLVIETCLNNHINYIDTASFWDFDYKENPKSPYKVEQLDFSEKFKKRKILGLINSGVSPGLTNLLAREASEELSEVNSIKIRIIEDTRSDKLYFPWCVEWLLDEINYEPLVYRNKKFKIAGRFSEEEVFDFKSPFGKKKVALFSQEEVGTIPMYIKVNNLEIKGYDSQSEAAKFLLKLGLTSDQKIKIENIKISPRTFLSKILSEDKKLIPSKWEIKDAQFGLAVIAEGKKDGKKKKISYYAVFPKEGEIDKLNLNANFISYPTALMLKIFIMAFSKIKKFGVFPPENLDKETRAFVLNELKKNKIYVKKY